MVQIRDAEKRVEQITEALAAAAAGRLAHRLVLSLDDEEDALRLLEHSINVMLEDLQYLRTQDEERNQQLTEMLQQSQLQTQQLTETLETVRNQQQSIAELSTPVLQLWEDVLAIPIIGVVDTKRSMDIMEKVLGELSTRQSRFVILDITGVEVVDTRTADHFIKVAKASRLLGATCIVSGIRPAVAQTLVEIGVDMSAVDSAANMKEALRECLKRMGRLQTGAA